MYKIKTEDIHLSQNINMLVVGKMKDETSGVTIKKFLAL